MKKKYNGKENGEVQAAKINARATIFAAIAGLIGIFVGRALESNSIQTIPDQEINEANQELINQLKGENQELENQLSEASQKIEELENQLNDSKSHDESDDVTISFNDVQFVEQNFDLIKQLKSEYTEVDTKIIANDNVEFKFFDNAGYIYQNLMKTGNYSILQGERISFVKVIIMDYDSNEIIYYLNSENSNNVQFVPGNKNKFYGIVFRDDYDIYVTPPIQIIGGEGNEEIRIYLNKNKSKYTPLCQICLQIQNFESDNSYSIDDYIVFFECKNIYTNSISFGYNTEIPDSGILNWEGHTYFSLNTNYIMNIYLYQSFDDKSCLAELVFDGSTTNSNQIELVVDLERYKNDIKK